MRLQILGTAAAEGWPAVFCGCTNCQRARELGGRNIRTRSGAVLGTTHKIDFSPDSFSQALRHSLDWEKLEHIFVTHSHGDHFYPAEIAMRQEVFAHPPVGQERMRELRIYGDRYVYERLVEAVPNYEAANVTFHQLEAFTPVRAGSIMAVPLPADHMLDKNAFIYLFSEKGKTLLYALDTGWFPGETWDFLDSGLTLDCVVLDATCGSLSCSSGHMGIGEVIRTKEELTKRGLLAEKAVVIANHFSHNGGLLHHELEERLAPHGIITAYDGMTVAF